MNGNVNPNMIMRVSDNAFIPRDSLNKDWLQYESWLAEGNVPLPPD